MLKLAVEDYTAAVTRNPIPGPGLVRALLGRSHVNFLLDSFDDSAADALRAADIAPTEDGAWANAGDALTLGGKPEDAVKKAWRPGIKAVPASARLHHGLGMTLWRLGAKGSDAINELKEATKLAPSEGRYRLSYGEALYQAYREKEALPELLQATGLRDKDRESWNSLAHTYVALHRWQEAADAYEKICELDVKAVDEHIYLAIIYADRLKLKDKAKAHCQTYTDRGGADPLLAGWIEALMAGK